MNPDVIKQLQQKLGVSPTGVFDTLTLNAMNAAVSKSVAKSPTLKPILANNSPDSIATAYLNNDWSGVTDLSGKPFSTKDQEGALSDAERALKPGFQAQQEFDTAGATSDLQADQDAFKNFNKSEATAFKGDKDQLDQTAADNGVLFAGARTQKERNLKDYYDNRQEQQREQTQRNIQGTARDYEYKYGNDAAGKLSSYYSVAGPNSYNAASAGPGNVSSGGIASVYNPSAYNFQGTALNANKAAAQTRAAGLLVNRGNKLSLSGYANKF